jgi:hypothetical protein
MKNYLRTSLLMAIRGKCGFSILNDAVSHSLGKLGPQYGHHKPEHSTGDGVRWVPRLRAAGKVSAAVGLLMLVSGVAAAAPPTSAVILGPKGGYRAPAESSTLIFTRPAITRIEPITSRWLSLDPPTGLRPSVWFE